MYLSRVFSRVVLYSIFNHVVLLRLTCLNFSTLSNLCACHAIPLAPPKHANTLPCHVVRTCVVLMLYHLLPTPLAISSSNSNTTYRHHLFFRFYIGKNFILWDRLSGYALVNQTYFALPESS